MTSHRWPRPSWRIRALPPTLERAPSGPAARSNCCGTRRRAFTWTPPIAMVRAAESASKPTRSRSSPDARRAIGGRECSTTSSTNRASSSRRRFPTTSPRTFRQRMDPAEHMTFDVEHDVVAAQPFFSHILHDAIVRAGRRDLIPARCMKWWPQIERGDTAFEEYWDARTGTGSRCHAWSATPTYDLTTWVLGVRPAAPGYSRAEIAPQFGIARHLEGRVPTPHGLIEAEAGSRRAAARFDSRRRHCGSCGSTTRLSPAASSVPGRHRISR